MKKITSLLLVIVLIMSPVVVSATNSPDVVSSSSAESFLKMLGVIDYDDTENTVTRAQFTHMLMKAMNQGNPTLTDGIFADVTSSTLYGGDITHAYTLGIVNGASGGMFSPDDPITADAALKMTILALGYEDVAAAYGGYPYGYQRVAKELDLTCGADMTNGFGKECIYQLLFNFLNADVCKVSAVSGGSLTLERDWGNTPLTLWFDFQKTEGVIRTAGYVSMLTGFEREESVLYVNGVSYSADIENIERYLGKSASVWYDKSGSVRAIFENEDNKSFKTTADMIDRIDGNTVYVYDEVSSKETKLTLDVSYTFVKNGSGISPDKSDFFADGAEYEFVDNSGDNKYDVVIAKVPQYMVVSYINAVEGIVFDTNGSGKQLILDEDSGIQYTLTTVNKDGVVEEMYMEDLVADDVIRYYISDDGKYVDASMCNDTVSGTISEIADNKIVINGFEYKLNSYFGDPSRIKFGVNYKFLLAPDGTVTDIASAKSGEMKYGFLVKFRTSSSGLEQRTMAGILMPDNELLEAEVAQKITFNGKGNTQNNSDEILRTLTNGANTRCQLIRYSLNDAAMIDKIDTAVNIDASEYGYDKLLDESMSGNDSLTRHLYKTDVYYINESKTFTPNAVIGASTLFVSVPTDFAEDGSVLYDEEDFSFITTNDLGRYGAMNLTMYDINKAFEPGVVVVYNGINVTGKNVSVRTDASPAVVKNVSRGINEEGDYVYMFSLYRGKSAYKLSVSADKSAEIESGAVSVPSSGDIIRYATNSDGELANYRIDVRYIPAGDGVQASLLRSEESGALGKGLSNYAMHFGKSYFHTSTTVSLLMYSGKESSYNYFANVGVFKASSPNVIVYNAKSGLARQGNMDLMKDAVSTGEEDASLIAVKCYDNKVTDIIIYE